MQNTTLYLTLVGNISTVAPKSEVATQPGHTADARDFATGSKNRPIRDAQAR